MKLIKPSEISARILTLLDESDERVILWLWLGDNTLHISTGSNNCIVYLGLDIQL